MMGVVVLVRDEEEGAQGRRRRAEQTFRAGQEQREQTLTLFALREFFDPKLSQNASSTSLCLLPT